TALRRFCMPPHMPETVPADTPASLAIRARDTINPCRLASSKALSRTFCLLASFHAGDVPPPCETPSTIPGSAESMRRMLVMLLAPRRLFLHQVASRDGPTRPRSLHNWKSGARVTLRQPSLLAISSASP